MRIARSTPRRSASIRRTHPGSGRKSARLARSRPSTHHQVNVVARDRDRANQIHEGVMLHVAGFDFARRLSAALDRAAAAIDYSIDDPAIDTVTEYMGRRPEERARNEKIVDFIDVVFAPQQFPQTAEPVGDA